MKIVVLDGYAANPGDLSWEGMKVLGECTIYDRTAPEDESEETNSCLNMKGRRGRSHDHLLNE